MKSNGFETSFFLSSTYHTNTETKITKLIQNDHLISNFHNVRNSSFNKIQYISPYIIRFFK